MSDFNTYTLIFQNKPPELFSQIIEAAGSLGYSCTLRGEIYGLSLDGSDELKFGNVQSAQTHLFLEGGRITFVRKCESCEDSPFLSFEISFEPKSRAVSLNSPSLLNQQRWSLVEQAVDLRRLWTILSHRLKPLYGYATSVEAFETALNDPETRDLWEPFEQKIVYHSLPPVLFWANYFDWSYYENIDKTVFNDIPHRKFVMPEDYVCIYLAEFPWDDPQLAILKNWKYQLAISE